MTSPRIVEPAVNVSEVQVAKNLVIGSLSKADVATCVRECSCFFGLDNYNPETANASSKICQTQRF